MLQETPNKWHEEVSHATAYLLHASLRVSNADLLKPSVLSVVVVYGEVAVEAQSMNCDLGTGKSVQPVT